MAAQTLEEEEDLGLAAGEALLGVDVDDPERPHRAERIGIPDQALAQSSGPDSPPRMRVALVHMRHAKTGGTERYLDHLAAHLAGRGDDVRIVCRSHEEAPASGVPSLSASGGLALIVFLGAAGLSVLRASRSRDGTRTAEG